MRNNTKREFARAAGTSKEGKAELLTLLLSLAYGIGGVGKGLNPSHPACNLYSKDIKKRVLLI
jgi:hypothetical protein